MIEKTGTCVSNEKEKVKESQSRRVAPPLDIHIGCRVGGVTEKASIENVFWSRSLQVQGSYK